MIDFAICNFDGSTSMADVATSLDTEVTTNWIRCGMKGIGCIRAWHNLAWRHRGLPRPLRRWDQSARIEWDQRRRASPSNLDNGLGGAAESAGPFWFCDDFVVASFKSIDDFGDESALDTIPFDCDESTFSSGHLETLLKMYIPVY